MNFCAMSLTPNFDDMNHEILIVTEKMLGERIDEFVKDDSVPTRPCLSNGGRRNVTVSHLLLSRSNRRLPRACCGGVRCREVLR